MSADEIPPVLWGDTRRFMLNPPSALYTYYVALDTGILDPVEEEAVRSRLGQTLASATLAGAITLGSVASPQPAHAEGPEVATVFVVGDSIADGLNSPGNIQSLLAEKGIGVTGYVSQVSKRILTEACEVNPVGEKCQENMDGIRVLEANASAVDAADEVLVVLNTNGTTATVRGQTVRLGETAHSLSIADGNPAKVTFVGMFGNNKNVDAINRNREIEAAVADLRAEGINAEVLPLYDFVEQNLRPIGALSQASPSDVHPTSAGYKILASHIVDEISSGIVVPSLPATTPTPVTAAESKFLDLTYARVANTPAKSQPIIEAAEASPSFIDLRFAQNKTSRTIPVTAPSGPQIDELTPVSFVDISFQKPAATTPAGETLLPAISEMPMAAQAAGVEVIVNSTDIASVPVLEVPDTTIPESTSTEWPKNYEGKNGAELLLPIVSENGVGVSGDYNEQRSYGRHSGIDLTGLNPSGESDVLSGVRGQIISVDRVDDSEAGLNVVIGFRLSDGSTFKDDDRVIFVQHRELTELTDGLKVGQIVDADTVIGMIGDGRTSGSSDGPHDHLQLYTTNPLEDDRGFTIRATEGYTIDPLDLGFRQEDGTIMMVDDGEMVPAPVSESGPENTPTADEVPAETAGSVIDLVFGETSEPLPPAIVEELPEDTAPESDETADSVLDYSEVDPDIITQIIVGSTPVSLPPEDEKDEVPATGEDSETSNLPDVSPTEEPPGSVPPVVSEENNNSTDGATETNTTVTPEGLRGDTIPEQIVNYYVDHGYTKEGAYGIAANVQEEAQFDRSRTQNTWNGTCAVPPERLDPGTRNNPGPTRGYGFGIFQWTLADFQIGLQAYADSTGKPWYDLKTQMDYSLIIWEASYQQMHEILQTTTDSGVAARAVVSMFERPWPWDPKQGGNEYEQQKEMDRRANTAYELQGIIEAGNAASIDIACD